MSLTLPAAPTTGRTLVVDQRLVGDATWTVLPAPTADTTKKISTLPRPTIPGTYEYQVRFTQNSVSSTPAVGALRIVVGP